MNNHNNSMKCNAISTTALPRITPVDPPIVNINKKIKVNKTKRKYHYESLRFKLS